MWLLWEETGVTGRASFLLVIVVRRPFADQNWFLSDCPEGEGTGREKTDLFRGIDVKFCPRKRTSINHSYKSTCTTASKSCPFRQIPWFLQIVKLFSFKAEPRSRWVASQSNTWYTPRIKNVDIIGSKSDWNDTKAIQVTSSLLIGWNVFILKHAPENGHWAPLGLSTCLCIYGTKFLIKKMANWYSAPI